MSLLSNIKKRVKGTKHGVSYDDFVDSGIKSEYLPETLEVLLSKGTLWKSPNGRYFDKPPKK